MQRSTSDYQDLVTPFISGKPKFMQTVALTVQPFADLQTLILSLPQAFDLDYAIGAQLDITGQWIGQTRVVNTPERIDYFSFDDPARGFDGPTWFNPNDSAYRMASIPLLDTDYRQLLRANIVVNNWDGTVGGMQTAYDTYFARLGSEVFFDDSQEMTLQVNVAQTMLTEASLQILAGGEKLPIKPTGVAVNWNITSVNGSPLFGFDVDTEYVSGFDVGAWGVDPLWIILHSPARSQVVNRAVATAIAGTVTTSVS